MNPTEKKLLARYVHQRMELGETEWYLAPELVRRAVLGVETGHVSTGRAGGRVPESEDGARPWKTPVEPAPSVGGTGDSDLRARDSLGRLYEAVCDCRRCRLGGTRTNFVFGDGNPDADIMFIGEAPGAEEDAQGLPFVGRAGRLLTRMIEAIRLKREDVYIGNILKCRPPNNRDPKPEEIEACEPILIRQIEIIKPRVICALGRIAGQTLLRTKATLGSLRGTVHDYHGVKFIVTYHPAALLRNPQWKRYAWEDLKLVRREYDGLEL